MQTEADLEDAAPVPGVTTSAVPAPKAHDHLVDLPEPVSYRFKKRVLGPPIFTDRLAHERLGKPTALAVFASDNLSSSAYATEEILRVLIPAIGVFAFSMVVPITVAMLIVLGFLILSYRQTIKEYPSAGGAYIVTRDNFGIFWAQIAGVSLLTDYVLTVAVSTAAGAAALASAFEAFEPWIMPVAIVFVIVIAAGNLKGVKESGKAFAIPTYFFIANMGVLLTVGVVKMIGGALEQQPSCGIEGAVPCGQGTDGVLFFGATLFLVLHAFASGGAAVTGVEAISNGVPAFKEPSWKNARTTLVVMGSLLGVMFLGLSFLASKVNAIPFESGTPTVISQVGEFVYGSSGLGQVLFYALQAGTMLILVLAANTSFADFPRLASFQAGDNFMPKQLTKRGHRLVFSNGIVTLSAAAIVLLIVTQARVERLIPMYAIGVFLSFTLSQAGMAKHHIKKKESGWRRGLLINGIGAFLSGVVLIIFATTKFTSGAWVIIVLIPILVFPLFRLNKAYQSEREELVEDAHGAAEAPILDRHVVFVLIDELDMASARAIQYARALVPDELIAVHFDLDPLRTRELTSAWGKLGFARLSLDVVECPDRRIERAAADVVARQLARGDTEVSVLLPRREYSRFWHRFLHDRTADSIAKVLDDLPHCNVTIVPYHLGAKGVQPRLVTPAGVPADGNGKGRRSSKARAKAKDVPHIEIGDMEMPADRVPVASVQHRQRVRIAGKVYSVRVQPWSGVAVLELTLIDDTGAMQVVFFGRRELAGVTTGTRLVIEGVVGEHRGKMASLNPKYEIQAAEAPH
ncbi:MAG: amino acid permease [Actinobacteria bacterium]|nr:amino acid permease [Actinomycetota bacterium]